MSRELSGGDNPMCGAPTRSGRVERSPALRRHLPPTIRSGSVEWGWRHRAGTRSDCVEWSPPTPRSSSAEWGWGRRHGAGTRTAAWSSKDEKTSSSGVDQSLPTLSTDDAERGWEAVAWSALPIFPDGRCLPPCRSISAAKIVPWMRRCSGWLIQASSRHRLMRKACDHIRLQPPSNSLATVVHSSMFHPPVVARPLMVEKTLGR